MSSKTLFASLAVVTGCCLEGACDAPFDTSSLDSGSEVGLANTRLMKPFQVEVDATKVNPQPIAAACGDPTFRNPSNGYVIPHVNVVGVIWGSNVTPLVSTMVGFYVDILNSQYMDWLSEYSTPGTTIGRGVFRGMFQITPHNPNLSLSDADVQSELTYQISHGILPSNDANTLYAVYMPTNATVVDPFGVPTIACGGYHYFHGQSLIYSVVIDAPSCDSDNKQLAIISSHELIEAVTDPYTTAWHDSCGDEVGDYCDNHLKFSTPEHADRGYFAAEGYSNSSRSCIVQKAFQSADLLFRNNSYEYVWKVPNGGYYAAAGIFQNDTNWTIQGTEDINGDGISDIVWRHSVTGQVNIWFMNNGNTILPGSGVIGSADPIWSLRAIADVDGDGVADLVWHNSNTGEVYLWQLNKDGTPAVSVSLGYATGGWTLRGAGDFNGDGRADLLFTITSGGLQHLGIWIMNGTSVSSYLTWPTNPVRFQNGGEKTQTTNYAFGGIGDFNGDGVSDIAWQSSKGVISLWTFSNLASVCPGFQTCVNGLTGIGTAGAGYFISGVGDADANGTSDLFFSNPSTGDIWTWLVLWGPTPGVAAIHTGTTSTDYTIRGVGFFNLYPNVW